MFDFVHLDQARRESVFMYPLGLVYAMMIGAQSTPPTVLVGALLLVIGGAWMVWSILC